MLCCVDLGTIAATGTVALQVTECATTGGTFTDISGATVSAAADDDDTILFLEVLSPRLPFIRIDVDRGTANSTINTMFCVINQGQGNFPVTQSATPYAVAATPTRHQA